MCQFGVTVITFLGDELFAAGAEPDMDEVKALLETPHPEDKKRCFDITRDDKL